METLSLKDSWSRVFDKRRVIVWRPVRFEGSEAIPMPLHFEWGQGSHLARCVLGSGGSIAEPKASSLNSQGGVVLKIREVPDPNWTHVVVCGLTLALRTATVNQFIGAVNAVPAQPFDMDDYLRFRWCLHQLYQDADTPRKMLELHRAHSPGQLMGGEERVVIIPQRDAEFPFLFERICAARENVVAATEAAA